MSHLSKPIGSPQKSHGDFRTHQAFNNPPVKQVGVNGQSVGRRLANDQAYNPIGHAVEAREAPRPATRTTNDFREALQSAR